jgi:GNAT superfamily N-acetyltransferase
VEVDVVPASAALVPDLVALARAGRAEVADARGGALFVARECLPEPLEEAFEALRATGDGGLFAATVDGVAVGYAVVVSDGSEALLRELVVDPEARAIGLGELLLEAAIGWARARGCVGLGSYALPGARDTKNFFEAAGMKTRLLLVHRPL